MDMKAMITNKAMITRKQLAEELVAQFQDGLITESELQNKLILVGYVILPPPPPTEWIDGWIKLVS